MKINTKTIKVEGGMKFQNHDGDTLHIYFSDTLAHHSRFCWVREFNGELKTYGSAHQTKVEAERLIKKYGLIWIFENEDIVYKQIDQGEAVRLSQHGAWEIYAIREGEIQLVQSLYEISMAKCYHIEFPDTPTFYDELNGVIKDLIDYAEGLNSWEDMIFSNAYMGLQNSATVEEVRLVADKMPKDYDELNAKSRRFFRTSYDQLRTIINKYEKSV